MWNNFRKGWMGWLLHKTLSSKKSPCWYFLYFKQSTWHTKEWFDIGMIDWHVDRILLMIQKPGQPDDMENSLKYHIYLWNSNITGGARLLPSTVFTNMAKITSQIASNHENTLVKSHTCQPMFSCWYTNWWVGTYPFQPLWERDCYLLEDLPVIVYHQP